MFFNLPSEIQYNTSFNWYVILKFYNRCKRIQLLGMFCRLQSPLVSRRKPKHWKAILNYQPFPGINSHLNIQIECCQAQQHLWNSNLEDNKYWKFDWKHARPYTNVLMMFFKTKWFCFDKRKFRFFSNIVVLPLIFKRYFRHGGLYL